MVRPLGETIKNSRWSTGMSRPSARWMVNLWKGSAFHSSRIRSVVIYALYGNSPAKHGLLIDEANGIPERVFRVKGAFAPGAGADFFFEVLAVGIFGEGVNRIEVPYRYVDVVGVGLGVEEVAIGAGVEAGEDGAVAIEIVAAWGDAFAGGLEEVGVKLAARVMSETWRMMR